MIVPDLNLLLYATVDGFTLHERARAWWEGLLSGTEPVGIVAPVAYGFIRLATSRRVLATPMPVDAAVREVHGWLSRPHVTWLSDSARHLQIATDLLVATGAAGNLTASFLTCPQ